MKVYMLFDLWEHDKEKRFQQALEAGELYATYEEAREVRNQKAKVQKEYYDDLVLYGDIKDDLEAMFKFCFHYEIVEVTITMKGVEE